jgi:hypothetical protein
MFISSTASSALLPRQGDPAPWALTPWKLNCVETKAKLHRAA